MTREQACEHVEVSLKEYFDAKFEALKTATQLARENLEHRLEGLNELRKQVVADRTQFATREMVERLQKDVSDMARSVAGLTAAELSGEKRSNRSSTLAIAIIGGILSLIQIATAAVIYMISHQ